LAGWVVGHRRGSGDDGTGADGHGSRAGTAVREVGRRLSTVAAVKIARGGQLAVGASSRAVAAGGTAVAAGLASAIDVTADSAGKIWRTGSGVAARSAPVLEAVVSGARVPGASRRRDAVSADAPEGAKAASEDTRNAPGGDKPEARTSTRRTGSRTASSHEAGAEGGGPGQRSAPA
jgi:hypothetical protein